MRLVGVRRRAVNGSMNAGIVQVTTLCWSVRLRNRIDFPLCPSQGTSVRLLLPRDLLKVLLFMSRYLIWSFKVHVWLMVFLNVRLGVTQILFVRGILWDLMACSFPAQSGWRFFGSFLGTMCSSTRCVGFVDCVIDTDLCFDSAIDPFMEPVSPDLSPTLRVSDVIFQDGNIDTARENLSSDNDPISYFFH